MEHLANSFAVLELDADDSDIQPLSLPSGNNLLCLFIQFAFF